MIHDNTASFENIYGSLLDYVNLNSLTGACHSTSAVIYILFSELGLHPNLKIGEVYSYSAKACFDHSWVEMDDEIFDIAIGYPQPPELGGQYVCGPVFNSFDLSTGEVADICYRYQTSSGLAEPALSVSKWTLQEYNSNEKTTIDIWKLAVLIGSHCNMHLQYESLAEKYGNTFRDLIVIE
ncbi:hypothetical protein [Citrobacter braakii]|jgi:hypothetical protein|uniref:hypothetical protein n=1 Tax=Citrobacter braakii TaxID=57706 RepID=UPI00397CC04D